MNKLITARLNIKVSFKISASTSKDVHKVIHIYVKLFILNGLQVKIFLNNVNIFFYANYMNKRH